MKLREAIRTIVEEVAGEELRRIVREVLIEELMADESPRTVAAKKAAATRRANQNTKPVLNSGSKVPAAAKKLGIAKGQKYQGKDWDPAVKGRTIEVVTLEEQCIVPKILSAPKKRAQAKRISYSRLMSQYDRVE